MSRVRSPFIEYRCIGVCSEFGCEGHKLQLVRYLSSDTTAVEIDGKQEYIFDDSTLSAIFRAYKQGERGQEGTHK